MADYNNLFVSSKDLRAAAERRGMGALLEDRNEYDQQKDMLMKRAEAATSKAREPLVMPTMRVLRNPMDGDVEINAKRPAMPMPFTPSAALRKRRDELMPQPVLEEEEKTVAMVEKD